jgi:uncharacterized membrane protein
MIEMKYPRARLDALGDSITAVAMTLLVLDVRLPGDFNAANGAEFLGGIWALFPKFVPYALSFWVLGLRWLASVRGRHQEGDYAFGYGKWWLLYMFLITCVPFTTIAMGRFIDLAPAIWLYAGNIAALSLVGLMLIRHTPGAPETHAMHDRRISARILLVASALSVAISFFAPRWALWAMVLTIASPQIARRTGRGKTV